MRDLFARFDHVDTCLNQWLVTHSIPLLRIAMGSIFLVFGLLKFFPGLSPIEDLASRTTEVLSFGLVSGRGAMVVIAVLECLIGLSFMTGRFLRIGVWLLGAQMLGAMSPLVLFFGELFPGDLHTPTLAAQYIIKDVVLVAAGMVIASTWTGARLVPERRSMRSTLGVRVSNVHDGAQAQ
jgi:putative oxidoreductase